MTIYHKHHIVPKHAGGTDDPSNIIELTVEEHAEAHRKLFEEHGRWQDELAWQMLSGSIGKEEGRIIAVKKALTGVPKSPEHRAKISKFQKGRKLSPEVKKNIAEGRKKWKFTEENKKNISESIKKHWQEKRKDMPVKEITKKRRSESIKKWWAERKLSCNKS